MAIDSWRDRTLKIKEQAYYLRSEIKRLNAVQESMGKRNKGLAIKNYELQTQVIESKVLEERIKALERENAFLRERYNVFEDWMEQFKKLFILNLEKNKKEG